VRSEERERTEERDEREEKRLKKAKGGKAKKQKTHLLSSKAWPRCRIRYTEHWACTATRSHTLRVAKGLLRFLSRREIRCRTKTQELLICFCFHQQKICRGTISDEVEKERREKRKGSKTKEEEEISASFYFATFELVHEANALPPLMPQDRYSMHYSRKSYNPLR
jgi:hypothetical protein